MESNPCLYHEAIVVPQVCCKTYNPPPILVLEQPPYTGLRERPPIAFISVKLQKSLPWSLPSHYSFNLKGSFHRVNRILRGNDLLDHVFNNEA